MLILLVMILLLHALELLSTYLAARNLVTKNMNPHIPEQHYPLSVGEQALGRCLQERENAKFLIETKQQLLKIIQQGYNGLHDLDSEIVLPNGLVLPSPRQILDHDIQHHTAVIDRQNVILEDILTAEASLRNAIRRRKQSYEILNMRKLIKKQQRYDKYQLLQIDLTKLEDNIRSLDHDLDQDIKRLNQLQAINSSNNNSANSNND